MVQNQRGFGSLIIWSLVNEQECKLKRYIRSISRIGAHKEAERELSSREDPADLAEKGLFYLDASPKPSHWLSLNRFSYRGSEGISFSSWTSLRHWKRPQTLARLFSKDLAGNRREKSSSGALSLHRTREADVWSCLACMYGREYRGTAQPESPWCFFEMSNNLAA